MANDAEAEVGVGVASSGFDSLGISTSTGDDDGGETGEPEFEVSAMSPGGPWPGSATGETSTGDSARDLCEVLASGCGGTLLWGSVGLLSDGLGKSRDEMDELKKVVFTGESESPFEVFTGEVGETGDTTASRVTSGEITRTDC